MKICFDTSVVIDIIGKTGWFTDSFASYNVSVINEFELYLSASSTTDIAYLLDSRCSLPPAQAREALGHLFEMFTIMDNTSDDCRLAHASGMENYEDALIAYTAQRYGVDFIITHNRRDFRYSPVRALTPHEFTGKLFKLNATPHAKPPYLAQLSGGMDIFMDALTN